MADEPTNSVVPIDRMYESDMPLCVRAEAHRRDAQMHLVAATGLYDRAGDAINYEGEEGQHYLQWRDFLSWITRLLMLKETRLMPTLGNIIRALDGLEERAAALQSTDNLDLRERANQALDKIGTLREQAARIDTDSAEHQINEIMREITLLEDDAKLTTH